METQEHRIEQRFALAHQPKGELQLLVGKESIQVAAVKDISQRGIRVLVDTPVEMDETVRVRFHHDPVDFQVNGTVVWSSAGEDAKPGRLARAAYLVGINLVSPTLLHAFL
jgi:hypothetical protein